MEITRTSRMSGITRTMDLPITHDQLLDYSRGALIQDAFYNLTPAQREFFMTGITEEEWDEMSKALDEMNKTTGDEQRGHEGC